MSFADINLPMLPPEQQAMALQLQREIAALREARECVTHGATSAVVYGRVDGLINARQNQMLELFRAARLAEASEVQLRG